MKLRKFALTALVLSVASPVPAKADMFGGDVLVLTQILANALQQLYQLKSMVEQGSDTLGLIRNINRGINDSLGILKTIGNSPDAGLYGSWTQSADALKQINQIYGTPPNSKESRIQQDADQGVAEAVALNNSMYLYTRDIDQIGEQVKGYSHNVSPGGAQKLTAQTLGIMLHVMNQNLRTQAKHLKLQAQSLAIQNRRDKEDTRQMLADSDQLKMALTHDRPQFAIPRFE